MNLEIATLHQEIGLRATPRDQDLLILMEKYPELATWFEELQAMRDEDVT